MPYKNYRKISDSEYDWYLTLEDFERFIRENPNYIEKVGPLGYNEAHYKIKNDKGSWKYNLVSMEESCNMPDNKNTIFVESGCFEFSYGGKVLGTNPISNFETDALRDNLKIAAMDYYSRVNTMFLSDKHVIRADYTKKLDDLDNIENLNKQIQDSSFEVYLGTVDSQYLKQKYGDAPGDYAPTNTAKYLITKDPVTNFLKPQFVKFEDVN